MRPCLCGVCADHGHFIFWNLAGSSNTGSCIMVCLVGCTEDGISVRHIRMWVREACMETIVMVTKLYDSPHLESKHLFDLETRLISLLGIIP